MPVWVVEYPIDVFNRVPAERLEVIAGALVFSRRAGASVLIELALAPGQWLSVHEQPIGSASDSRVDTLGLID